MDPETGQTHSVTLARSRKVPEGRRMLFILILLQNTPAGLESAPSSCVTATVASQAHLPGRQLLWKPGRRGGVPSTLGLPRAPESRGF